MNKRYYCIFLAMLCVQIVCFTYIFSLKPDLFQDEYWTFNFANSNYYPLIDQKPELFNRWMKSDFWHHLLTVQPGEQFNYQSVYYNTAQDVHPPLYYYIIHTVCSLFPNKFNIWFGYIPNVIYFCLTQLVLFKCSRKLLKNSLQCLMPCFIYGFSLGTIQTVVMIRMYMALTFACTLSFYLHWSLLEKFSIKKAVFIAIVNAFGFLTHYYYLIFATVLYFSLIYIFVKTKKYKQILLLTVVNLVALALCVVYFPACINHILGIGNTGYRGKEILAGLTKWKFVNNLQFYIKELVYNEPVVLFMLLFVSVYAMLKRITHTTSNIYLIETRENQNWFLYIATFSIIFTFVIIVYISCLLSVRYLYMLFPVMTLCSYYVFLNNICISGNWSIMKGSAVIVVLTVFALYPIRGKSITYLNDIGNDLLPEICYECLDQKHVKECIFINPDDDYGFVICSLGLLNNIDKTYITDKIDLQQLDKLTLDNHIIVAINPKLEKYKTKIITYFQDNLGYKKIHIYYDHSTIGWYVYMEK